MCGIIGVIGKKQAAPRLIDGLRRLEYRGYDSSGIATLVNGEIFRRRAEGKIDNLAALIKNKSLNGTTGIGHTRWATHGGKGGKARYQYIRVPTKSKMRNAASTANQTFLKFEDWRQIRPFTLSLRKVYKETSS